MDDTKEPVDPHAAAPDEDPEQHIGEEMPDPWDDPDQTDWPNESVELDEEVDA